MKKLNYNRELRIELHKNVEVYESDFEDFVMNDEGIDSDLCVFLLDFYYDLKAEIAEINVI